ncbi:MAG: hypothetical protein WBO55_17175 [Rhizobiaceae bacterium]
MEKKHPAELFFSSEHPISSYLNVKLVSASHTELVMSVVAPDSFVIDVQTGELHSGFATLMLDTVMGGTVFGGLEVMQPIATAGLTAQHMRRPRRGEQLLCIAQLQGIHRDMAHMNGKLVTGDQKEILSTATGTFMIGTRAKPLGARV